MAGSLNGEMRESEALLSAVQSVFGGDNGPLMVAPRFKFNAKRNPKAAPQGGGETRVHGGQMSGRDGRVGTPSCFQVGDFPLKEL